MDLLAGSSPRRKPLPVIACVLAAFCLPWLVLSLAHAQTPAKGKTVPAAEKDGVAGLFTFPAKIKLSDKQKAKLHELKRTFNRKLAGIDARLADILTPERARMAALARTAAAAKGHSGKELSEAGQAAMNLSDDEKQKLEELEDSRQHLYEETRAAKLDLLTPEQRALVTPKPDFWLEFAQKLFQPLLLFFYLGFLIPLLKVPYRFPKQVYQGITLYLLVAIGWHGGEELAKMTGAGFQEAMGFVVIGFCANIVISIVAYVMLRRMTRMRMIDCATVGGYYGSDSAGTFLTCVGVLMVMGYKEFGYMPVLLAVMETPGCLVCLYQIARLRRTGMDRNGNMPWEEGYDANAAGAPAVAEDEEHAAAHGEGHAAAHATGSAVAVQPAAQRLAAGTASGEPNGNGAADGHGEAGGFLSWKILHEVFFNPGLYFLFGGILIGLIAGKLFIPFGKEQVIASENLLFVTLMHGVLCLFLLEMGITACERLRDLKSAGVGFIVFGILAPNLFALFGIVLAHLYSMALGHPFTIPQYALFAVLCGAASYIAVPAVQRMAIPEASPTLPLAASLGLTFTWNVTLGIPIYISIAQLLTQAFPVT